ncbi:TPA: 30S ribosomal protein S16 [Candidatus Uhrbacteria bacterium]|nr:30S ribosomal protein S16 [Candidatus Uhrbacteria bacterium]
MLSIRLTRTGKIKQPYFRVIVTEKSRDPWGKVTEILGNLNPRTKKLVLNNERVLYWISKGAQPTDRIRNMLIEQGIIKGDKKSVITISKKRKAKIDAKASEKAQANSEPKA